MGMSIFGALFMGGMALMLKNEYQCALYCARPLVFAQYLMLKVS